MIRFKIGNGTISILDIAYFICSIVVTVVCIICAKGMYSSIWFLPLTFCGCLIFLIDSGKRSLTVKIATFCMFLRYVVLSLFQSISPTFGFSDFHCTDTENINKAIGLMCYELIFISIYFQFYTSHFSTKVEPFDDKKFSKNKNTYYAIFLFSIFAIGIGFLVPNALKDISFLVVKSNTGVRLNASVSSTMDMMIRQIFIVGILSLFVVTTMYLKNNYSRRHPKLALNITLLFGLACTSMIVSEQRSSQVYCGFATLILLIQVYPKYRKKIMKTVILGAGFVLVMLTIYKTFYAFNFSSYSEAIMQSSRDLTDFVSTLEIYLLGPLTVASVISFGNVMVTHSIFQLLFDLCRSTVGISFLVKSSNLLLTSENYNLYITKGRSLFGYLMPITTEGYLFLGFAMAPILICICFYFAFKIEKIMFRSKSAYVIFFSAYIYIRLATCMVSSNINTVLTSASIMIISAGLVYLIQWIMNQITGGGK
ncbi:hypothetical protein [Dorea sp.]